MACIFPYGFRLPLSACPIDCITRKRIYPFHRPLVTPLSKTSLHSTDSELWTFCHPCWNPGLKNRLDRVIGGRVPATQGSSGPCVNCTKPSVRWHLGHSRITQKRCTCPGCGWNQKAPSTPTSPSYTSTSTDASSAPTKVLLPTEIDTYCRVTADREHWNWGERRR